MTEELSNIAFPAGLTDPDDIEWQFSLGATSLDRSGDPRFPGMTALEACLRLLCQEHASDSGRPAPTEERSLRLLVEDALGSGGFQATLLPKLVRIAIESNNLFLVQMLLSYSESEEKVLALANAPAKGGAGGGGE